MRRLLSAVLCFLLSLPGASTAQAASRALTSPSTGIRTVTLPAALPTMPSFTGMAAPLPGATTLSLPSLNTALPLAGQAQGQAAQAKLAPAVAAQAQLERAQAALALPKAGEPKAASSVDPAQGRESAEKVWSGSGEQKSRDGVAASAPRGFTRSLLPKALKDTAGAGRKMAATGAVIAGVLLPSTALAGSKVAAPLAAAPDWLISAWQAVQPYAEGAAVLGVTYLAHRIVRWTVAKLAKKAKWDPNTADTARFIATMATWALGATVGMHLAGASATAMLTGFGVAMTLAVKKTIGNLLQGVQFLVNRPFVIGDKMRVADNLYEVSDMELQYVTMKQLGKLALEKPEVVPEGVEYIPFKEVDPLHRDADDKGYRWLIVRKTTPGPLKQEVALHEAKLKYSNLAAVSLTLFRTYQPSHELHKPDLASLKNARRPFAAVGKFFGAIKETPRGSLLKAVLWMAASIALIPILPWVQGLVTWQFLSVLFPYIHGLAAIWATRQVARFFERLVPLVGKKMGWNHQSTVVLKLLAQAGVYFIGLSAALRAMGLEWGMVATSMGATAAAMSFASSDILGNLAQALMLRFDRPFDIGDTLRVGTDVGVVQEMNMFHVVLKVADGSHTLVPYSVIDATALETFDPPPANAASK